MLFFTLLIFTTTTITCVVCDETFTIVPSDESSCPENVCYTLDQFASNFSLPSEDGGFENITLELQPGSHTLDVHLILKNMTRFEIRGVNASCAVNSAQFVIEDTQFTYIEGINFTINSQLMFVKNANELIIKNCSMESNQSFEIFSTDNVLIVNSHFVKSSSLIFDIQRSVVVIRESMFADNTPGPQGLISSDYSSVTMENCVFANNFVNSSFSGLFTSSLGSREDLKLVVVNSTFFNNRAGGGLINTLLSFFESIVIYGCTFSTSVVDNRSAAVSVRGQSVEITHTIFDNNSLTDFYGRTLDVSADSGSIGNCTFIDNNSSGGGAVGIRVQTVNSTFVVEQNRFINNAGGRGNGGGLSLRGDSCRSLIVRENLFTNNSGASGGALYMSLGRNCRTVLVEQNIFTTNSASSGGAVYYRESTPQRVSTDLSTDVVITDNVFISNSASSCGSAIVGINSQFRSSQQTYRLTLDSNVFSTSGAIVGTLLCFSDGNITIRNSSFSQNSGNFNGGALRVTEAVAVIEDSTFRFNYAGNEGGAIYATDSSINITNLTVEDNQARFGGGAIAIYRGVLVIQSGSFRNNSATRGRGDNILACDSEVVLSNSSMFEVSRDSFDECLLYNKALSHKRISSLACFVTFTILSIFITMKLH